MKNTLIKMLHIANMSTLEKVCVWTQPFPSEGLDLAMRAILDPGDKVLVPEPVYVSYGPVVELAGGKAEGRKQRRPVRREL